MTPQDLPSTIDGSLLHPGAHARGHRVMPHGESPPQPGGKPAPSSQQFASWLRLWLPHDLDLKVVFTNNRSTLLSFRRSQNEVRLRLHHLFAGAGPDVAYAVCLYVRGTPGGSGGQDDVLRRYVAHIQRSVVGRALPSRPLQSKGHVHHLEPLFHGLNTREFGGRCTAAVTWGRAASGNRRRRSITLGSYCPAQNLIRMHPSLDQTFVPQYVVEGVLHHEMLHEVMGIEERGGRRRMHPPEFVAIERLYRDHERCLAWERAHIGQLLRYRP